MKMLDTSVSFLDFDPNHTDHLDYAVIVSFFEGKWVFVRHKERTTLEVPGGKREAGENILSTAARELTEETGASDFNLVPLEVYQVSTSNDRPASLGLLCYAEIRTLGPLLDTSEIAEVVLSAECPEELTHSNIQLKLFHRIADRVYLATQLKPYKHIIWDWNGTLIDDIQLALKAIAPVLAEHDLEPLSLDRYRKIFGFPISEYYTKLGFDLNKQAMDTLSTSFHANYNALMREHSSLFAHASDHLSILGKYRKQSILSAAAQWHLDDWVRSFGIDHHFDHIFGIDNHNATSKIYRGHELIAISVISPADTILVGDTDHDLEVANELGISALLVADGHQSFDNLSKIHHNVVATRYPAPTTRDQPSVINN